MVGQLLGEDVGNGRGFENVTQARADRHPDVGERCRGPRVCRVLRWHAAYRGEWAFGCPDHVREPDRRRIGGKSVAACRPTLGFEQTGSP